MRTYEEDFAGWAEDTALAIEEGRWSDIDRAALADEVGDLARSERRKIISRCEMLLTHLLKQRYQPEKITRSWKATIGLQRQKLRRLLKENPSLRSREQELILEAYQDARYQAARETGFDVERFPETLPFTAEDIWTL